MTQTLGAILVQAARLLEAYIESTATGGTTASIVDTKLAALGFADDDFTGGTAFHIWRSAGVVNLSRVVSDFVASTGTLSVTPDLPNAPVAGDVYGVLSRRYPRQQVVAAINQALAELGGLPNEDVSLTTLADTRDYTLAAPDIREVYLAQDTAAPWDWERQLGVTIRRDMSESAAEDRWIISFPADPPVGYKIRVVHLAPHRFVQADADLVSDFVRADWLAYETAVRCVRWRLQQSGADDKVLMPLLNDLTARAARARRSAAWSFGRPRPQPVLPNVEIE